MKNSRVFLRGFNVEECEIIYSWFLEDEVQKHTSGKTIFASKDFIKKWVEDKIFDKNEVYLAICHKENNEFIGYLSVTNIDYRNRIAQWGGILIGDKEYWNKGFATDAAKLMIKYVFEELNINLFWAYWLEEHTASIKMGEKVGFKKTGFLPQSIFKGGKSKNQIIMCILKEDYDLIYGKQK